MVSLFRNCKHLWCVSGGQAGACIFVRDVFGTGEVDPWALLHKLGDRLKGFENGLVIKVVLRFEYNCLAGFRSTRRLGKGSKKEIVVFDLRDTRIELARRFLVAFRASPFSHILAEGSYSTARRTRAIG